MIRMNPAHDIKNPPGCHYEKPLASQIEDYKQTQLYQQGYKDGYVAAVEDIIKVPEALTNSEYAR